MFAEIITIGDEILIGQIVDTNSAWMAEQLNLAGISVKQISSVSDESAHILTALAEAEERADIILITGGLGPTKDDITKKTLCHYFKDKMIFNESVFEQVKEMFVSRGLPLLDANRLQAEVPSLCRVLLNNFGTAPGLWFEKGKKIFVSMPGVPYEMKGIMEEHVLPELRKIFALPVIVHKTILTQGIGESFLAEKIAAWENTLVPDGIRLAYLPRPGQVRLRLSLKGSDMKRTNAVVDKRVTELYDIIPEFIVGMEVFGGDAVSIQRVIGDLLKKQKHTVSFAESCTGGYIAHLVTSVPGSSEYFMGSVVTYANSAKEDLIHVEEILLRSKGAVSEEVAVSMAIGTRKRFKTDFAVSVTGIAGPGGATATKPVGLVWIGIATPKGAYAEKFLFGKDRVRNIERMSRTALDMLRKELKKNI